jgi:predicted ribosome quality control (RQC) complex YloA/Tae2 family protein
MRDIAAIEVGAVVDELRTRLDSAFFKNFYELGGGAFLLALSRERKEVDVYIRPNKTINATSFREQPPEPTQFAKSVRKLLAGARLRSVEQHGLDRIVTMAFEARGGERRLVAELFGKGNLLIVGKGDITELAYRNVSFRERETRRNMVYGFPKSGSIGPEEMTPEGLARVIKEVEGSEGKLISELSRRIGIGPMYIEDAIARAGLDPNAPASGQDVGRSGIAREILSLLKAAGAPSPLIYRDRADNEYVDFAILPLQKYKGSKGIEGIPFRGESPMNDLLDELYRKERSTGVDSGKAGKIRELESSIGKLRKQKEELSGKAEEYAAVGNRIFERMGDINALIAQARAAKPKSAKDLEGVPGIAIKSVDPKSKTIKIEITD